MPTDTALQGRKVLHARSYRGLLLGAMGIHDRGHPVLIAFPISQWLLSQALKKNINLIFARSELSH
jgi:hypothetical protein